MTGKKALLLILPGLLLQAALLAGCLPTDMPAYIEDGKKIVISVKDDTSSDLAIFIYDIENGNVTKYPPPAGCRIELVRAFGDQIFVKLKDNAGDATRRFDLAEPASQPADKIVKCINDLDNDNWKIREQASELLMRLPSSQISFLKDALDTVTTDEKLSRLKIAISHIESYPYSLVSPVLGGDEDWLSNSFAISCEGRKCIFVGRNDPSGDNFDIYSLPDFQIQPPANIPSILSDGRYCWPAGGFWWTAKEIKNNKVEQVTLYNPQGKKVVTVNDEALTKIGAPLIGDALLYSRISVDCKTLFIASGNMKSMVFGLFDVGSAGFLWGGQIRHIIIGNPLITKDEVWLIEEDRKDEKDYLNLVRYSKGQQEGQSSSEVVMKYPAPGPISDDTQYNISPDGSRFVMAFPGDPPLLVFIPIRKDVTEKDVKIVKLQAASSPATVPAK